MVFLIAPCMKSVIGPLQVTNVAYSHLGYWYAPMVDSEQQALFEQVEIKPEAIEWMFAKAFGLKFRVSLAI